jgi:hypothetical protein
VVVANRPDPDFATIPHLPTEEKIVKDQLKKIKAATHMLAQVCLSLHFYFENKMILIFYYF